MDYTDQVDNSPRFTIRRPPTLPGLTIVDLEVGHHETVPHARDEVTLGLCRTGLDEFHAGRYHGPLWPGSILALNPQEIHHHRTRQGALTVLYSSLSLWGPGRWSFLTTVFQNPEVWALTEAVIAAEDDRIPDAWGALTRAVRALPGVDSSRGTGEPSPLLKDLSDELPSLEALAREAGLSRWTYLRRFRRDVGCTPQEYSRQARLTRASEALTRGTPIADAAQDAGFYDQSHFHRHFRRVFGVGPGEFRRRNSVQDGGSDPQ